MKMARDRTAVPGAVAKDDGVDPAAALRAGTTLALLARAMRVLEARFHPWRKARGPFLVVARVVCRRRRAVVEPTVSGLEDRSPSTMLQKLEYLVARSGPDTFDRLRQLRSDFWSFVEIDEGGQR
jgi:hypothetical protein